MTTQRNDSRIATKTERDDVDNIIGSPTGGQTLKNDDPKSAITPPSAQVKANSEKRIETILPPEKPTGGPVNRYLLCSLVSQSARRVISSGLQGDSSSVTTIGRRVLRSYLKAAMDTDSPLTDSRLDIPRLGLLNKKIVEDEIVDQAQNRVDESRGRHTESKRSGDETKTRLDQSELTRAIAHRDWLANKMIHD